LDDRDRGQVRLPRLTLVLGGARSGKSAWAEQAIRSAASAATYIATAEALDEEMRERIRVHRARRDGFWTTREAPLELAAAIGDAPAQAPVLVDCLTIWLSNLMHARRDIGREVGRLEDALAGRPAPTLLIANEVGLGIVPENALARRFRDEAGRLNQRLAAAADRVVLLVAGIAMMVKEHHA
jgi:adenosylcobinamide kinase/adenosylcobinamide-phosphate guanylyltransferase